MSVLQQDLTQGPILRQLIVFSLPLMCANILQLVYGIVDMLVVSQVVGTSGLAAVSNGNRLGFIISALGMGFSIGGTVIIARYFAAGEKRAQQETVGTLFSLAALLAVVMTCISLAGYQRVLVWLEVPPEAMPDAIAYTRIICAGTVFVFGYNTVCAVLRGFGNSRSPLLFVLIATVCNVVFDLLFVGPLGMGTQGAALATVMAQGIAFGAAVRHLRKHQFVFDFKLASFAIRWDKVGMIMGVGIPSAVQMVVVNLSFLVITGMLNPYGVAVAAASGIGLKINTLAGMPCWALGQAMTAMVAQNFGAGRLDRVKEIARKGLRVNLAVTITMVGLVQVFAPHLISLFDPTPEVVDIGVHYLRLCCSFNCVVYVTMYCFDSFALGVGRADVALVNSLLDAVVAKLALSWVAAIMLGMGYTGVYLGQACSALIPALMGALFYYRGRWVEGMATGNREVNPE